jgi:hypothetical protein
MNYGLVVYIAISASALPQLLFVLGAAAYFGVFNQFVARPKPKAKEAQQKHASLCLLFFTAAKNRCVCRHKYR